MLVIFLLISYPYAMSLRAATSRSSTVLVFPHYGLSGPPTLTSLLFSAAHDTANTSLLTILSTIYTSLRGFLLLPTCSVSTGSKLLNIYRRSVETFLTRQT